MIGRFVEIAEDGRHLSLSRGFLVVSDRDREIGRVPLDDIAVVMANAHGLTYSNALLTELSERGVVVVLCGSNHAPAAFLWPVEAHHVQARRMRAQIDAPEPLTKRLWRSLVRAKVRQQAAVLDALGLPGDGVAEMARRVRSGDPDNVEAQAARRYWPLLLGPDFRRDQDGDGANALLNYGYAVLRSTVARAIMGAGLHPSIGLHHSNRGNPMCLVDDVMEPFRPLVDIAVLRLLKAGHTAVTPETKRYLALTPTYDTPSAQGTTPLGTVVIRLGASLARVFEEGGGELDPTLIDRPWAPTALEWPTPDPPKC